MKTETETPRDEIVTGAKVTDLRPGAEPELPGMPDPEPRPIKDTTTEAPKSRRKRGTDTRTRHDIPKNAGTTEARRGPGKPSNRDKRSRAVTAIHEMLSMPLTMVAPVAGGALAQQAEPIGDAWAGWAETNGKVAKWLDSTLDGAGAATVIAAYLPVAAAVYAEISMRSGERQSQAAQRAARVQRSRPQPAAAPDNAPEEPSITPDAVIFAGAGAFTPATD